MKFISLTNYFTIVILHKRFYIYLCRTIEFIQFCGMMKRNVMILFLTLR